MIPFQSGEQCLHEQPPLLRPAGPTSLPALSREFTVRPYTRVPGHYLGCAGVRACFLSPIGRAELGCGPLARIVANIVNITGPEVQRRKLSEENFRYLSLKLSVFSYKRSVFSNKLISSRGIAAASDTSSSCFLFLEMLDYNHSKSLPLLLCAKCSGSRRKGAEIKRLAQTSKP